MKRGFTLVELLVVVVVIVTLMSIVFRLSGVGHGSAARNETINRMQRLENCLSGYYAAYGSYPPVKLHGSRDYMVNVNAYGIQQVGTIGSGLKGSNSSGADRANAIGWERVEAACRSQPLGMSFPFKESGVQDYIKKVSNMLIAKAQSNDPKNKKFRDNPLLAMGFRPITDNSMISELKDKADWTQAQIFKFGVMSYLLPRYLVMLGGSTDLDQVYSEHSSWRANNQLPCRFEDGVQYGDGDVDAGWKELNNDVRSAKWKVAAMYSQAVCARWLPNLEETVRAMYDMTLYGVQIRDSKDSHGNISAGNPNPVLYSTSSQGGAGSSGTQYVLDEMTVVDGWDNEFYYYSPPPYQSYVLWSAGPNEKTFPPWVSDEEIRNLKSAERDLAKEWKSDDIVKMSH